VLTLFSTTLLLSISFSSFAYYQLPFWPDKTYLTPEAAAAAYLDILGGGSCKRDTRNFIKASISSINTPHIAYRIDKYLDDQCIVFSSTGNASVTLNVVDNCPDGTSPDLSTGMCKPKPDTPQYCGTSAMFEDVANLY
ncbi:hypothetical protein, partial [Klebsiella variicola]|uniref:hypothetical protein n=10 Tax=Gammaproteobacteria TaxID=1236 RepID=UPI001C65E97C